MIEKTRNLIITYFTLGSDNNTSKNDLKKIILLHIFCNTWHLFTIISFIEDFFKDKLLIVSYIIMLIFVISVQILLYYKKCYIASILFLFNLFTAIFLLSNYMYIGELLEYYFILPSAISLIYIDNRKLNIAIMVICLLGLYIPNLYFNHYPYSVLNNINPPFLFFSIFIVISYFKNLNIRNEKILEAKTRELKDLDKFKSQFFTNISHEIRTPLTLINGQISDLDPFSKNTQGICLIQKNIKKQLNNITNMVNDVLDLSKMQSHGFQLKLKPTNVSEMLHKVFINFESLFKQKNMVFNFIENGLDYICTIDIVYFERAINNIIINALKYTDSGEINLKISEQKGQLFIEISDTGIGIAESDQNAIFNRFYQINNDINKSGGSGVGLAFSKEIIEFHGGEILLKSEPDKGSTFTMVLPFEKSQTKKTKPLVAKALPLEEKENLIKDTIKKKSNYTFLVVDDNFDMRKYLIHILQNYNCLEASNGLEALKVIKEDKVDFIITDHMMPKLNGYEFVKKLKNNDKTIPIIMLTAITDMQTKLNVLQLGIDDYITKPFDNKELLVRIENCIKNATSRNIYNQENCISPEENDTDFINALKKYIYENSNKIDLNQEFIAEEFNISKSSFYRKVKSHTGLSPNNFIKEIRLQKAREILEKNPVILLKQLALEVGYSHGTHFSKIYSQRFGIRPINNSK